MRISHSIGWRLQFWYGVMLCAVLAGGGIAAYKYQRAALYQATDDELERRAGAWARLRDFDRPPPRRPDNRGPARPRPPEENIADADALGSWYAVRWNQTGEMVGRSVSAPADCPAPETTTARTAGPRLRARGPYREALIQTDAREYLAVGCNLTDRLRRLNQAAAQTAAAAVALLAAALLVGRWLVERALRPIAAISAVAEEISRGDLSRRVRHREQDSELGQLTSVLNSTFARLETVFQRQAQFTADAAHELRTPVSIILTHTQNALAVPEMAEEHREAFAACQRAARRMRSLLESLLRLARLDSREEVMRCESLDLADRVKSVLAALSPIAAARGITLATELAPAVCPGDPDWLDQVITNLVDNAIKYNADGGQVRVTTHSGPTGVVLVVADDGPGIAPGDLPRVFERFYRADHSRSRTTGGAGLGLAIARVIVEAHRGTIAVESPPGRGATFTVRLPT